VGLAFAEVALAVSEMVLAFAEVALAVSAMVLEVAEVVLEFAKSLWARPKWFWE